MAKKKRERAGELEYFRWWRLHADFGPAHGDVCDFLDQQFMDETGKNLPEGWNYASDGETVLDR